MNYILESATNEYYDLLVNYKRKSIFDYADNITDEEITRINNFINRAIKEDINLYKIIKIDNKIAGCILVKKNEDGIILDEIYIEEIYRKKGIGTNIINNIIKDNNIIYLWVYKLNTNAISLYKKLGFNVIEETETRYFMQYKKEI